jgi:molybdopterin/thiamine biosynthesis adenylyltransferase
MAMGWPLGFESIGVTKETESARFARQGFLGPGAPELLAKARVGIIGAGGGGSHVIQQLAHLGFGDLTVFDPDTLEETNLPRTVGATEQDVVDEKPKVEIAARLAQGIRRSGAVRPFRARWQEHPDELRRCHLVVGAADTFAERRELEVACRRFLIPYVDIGMEVVAGARPSFRMAGQVIASVPGGPCMWCLNFLTEARLAQEARKYGAVGGRPQVVWANGVLASTAVGMIVDLITGWTGVPKNGAYLSFDGNTGLLKEHPLWEEDLTIQCRHYPLEQSGMPTLSNV